MKDIKKNKEVEEKDTNDSNDTLGLIIFILAVGLILVGIIFGPNIYSIFSGNSGKITSTEKYYFNNYEFKKIGPLWYTQIQKDEQLYDIPMHYGPKELLEMQINNTTIIEAKKFLGEFIMQFPEKDTGLALSYITFDPGDNLSNVVISATELTIKLRQITGIKLISACIDNSTGTGCEGRSMITCNNTKFPVIFLNEINNGKNLGNMDGINVRIKDNCLTIEGEGNELLKYVDRLLYATFNIMN